MLAFITPYLPVVQLVISILLIGAVLLQTRGAGMSGAFADANNDNYYRRRGAELFLFRATIVLSIVFALTALAALI